MTTQTPEFSQAQIDGAQSQADAIANTITSSAVGSNTFVFFAAFDGTDNGANPPADGSGDNQTTAVKQLFDQVLPTGTPTGNIGGDYEPGVGTTGNLLGDLPFSSGWDVLVTAQSIQKAQDAYNQFAAQAAAWLAEPGHTGGSLTSMITGFSRGGAGGGDEAQDSEPEGQELLYSTRVSLERTRMQVDDRMVSLSPGMAVTVEIKTGSRHVIEYLLSPLLRHKQQAMREQ